MTPRNISTMKSTKLVLWSFSYVSMKYLNIHIIARSKNTFQFTVYTQSLTVAQMWVYMVIGI